MSSLSEKDQALIWHPYTQMKHAPAPTAFVKGQGTLLYTESGDAVIDAISSWWVNLHGHCHPYISEAVKKQVETLEHAIFAGFTHEPAVKLAEKLMAISPDQLKKVFYSDNGSTAVEIAVKMALQSFRNQGKPRHKIISFEGGFHGETFGAMSVSAQSVFTEAFKDYCFDCISIPVPTPGNEAQAIEAFKAACDEEICAFIYEPLLQGASGMVMYSAEALNEMIGYAQSKGAYCIADEVAVGFGRSGKIFASDYMENKPDFMCFSKALTGGYMALGATLCTNEVYTHFLSDDPLHTFYHGHSFTANPISCTAALASIELLMQPEQLAKINWISAQHRAQAKVWKAHGMVNVVRQLGTVIAIEIKADQGGYNSNLRQKLYDFFMSQNVLLRPLGNIVYIFPPLSISAEELNKVYATITAALNALEEGTL